MNRPGSSGSRATAQAGSALICTAYACSASIAAAARGTPQRGSVHSVFAAAANIVFPGGFILSLNALSSPRMPNGLQLSASGGTFPFNALRAGMPVLFGAQRLHIEAIGCSLDLSFCSHWNSHIEHPEQLDMEVIRKNGQHLSQTVFAPGLPWEDRVQKLSEKNMLLLAQYLCGRGRGLTPTGDDILAGWMAIGWLLYGPDPTFLAACQQIMEVAKRQTHLLSQCWLGYAAQGDVAEPIVLLLEALTRDDEMRLDAAVKAVLAMGATSGHDVLRGILLGLEMKLD